MLCIKEHVIAIFLFFMWAEGWRAANVMSSLVRKSMEMERKNKSQENHEWPAS